MAIEAFVLVQTEVGKAALVAERIAELPGVRTAEDVLGPYDVIVRIAGGTDTELTDVVAAVQKVAGITRTLTCQLAGKPVGSTGD